MGISLLSVVRYEPLISFVLAFQVKRDYLQNFPANLARRVRQHVDGVDSRWVPNVRQYMQIQSIRLDLRWKTLSPRGDDGNYREFEGI